MGTGGNVVALREYAARRNSSGQANGFGQGLVSGRAYLFGERVLRVEHRFGDARCLSDRKRDAGNVLFNRMAREAVYSGIASEQLAAVESLIPFGEKAVVPLMRVLESCDRTQVLNRVLEALHSLDVKRSDLQRGISVRALKVLIEYGREGLRVNAALCLAKYGDEKAVPGLIRVLTTDERMSVKGACVMALKGIRINSRDLRQAADIAMVALCD